MDGIVISLGRGAVLISFREWLHSYQIKIAPLNTGAVEEFSSLSESGFIPTSMINKAASKVVEVVLISFREWLHSYTLW